MIAEELAKLPGAESAAPEDPKLGCAFVHTLPADAIHAAAQAFREAGFILELLTVLDERAGQKCFTLVYQFTRPVPFERHRVRIAAPPDPTVPSISSVYESANWYEREAFDMFGVEFSDHPQLERILTEEGADYFPLRKDFTGLEEACDG